MTTPSIEIPADLWNKAEKFYSGMILGEGKCKELLTWENKRYVIHGIYGDSLHSHEVVPFIGYEGKVYLKFKDMMAEIKTEEDRSKFYHYLKITNKDGEWVIMPNEVHFLRREENLYQQTSLF